MVFGEEFIMEIGLIISIVCFIVAVVGVVFIMASGD